VPTVRRPRLSRTHLLKAIAWLRWGPGLACFGVLAVWPSLSASERRALVRDLCAVGAALVAGVAGALTIAPWWTWGPGLLLVALRLDEVSDRVLAFRDRTANAADDD